MRKNKQFTDEEQSTGNPIANSGNDLTERIEEDLGFWKRLKINSNLEKGWQPKWQRREYAQEIEGYSLPYNKLMTFVGIPAALTALMVGATAGISALIGNSGPEILEAVVKMAKIAGGIQFGLPHLANFVYTATDLGPDSYLNTYREKNSDEKGVE